MKSSSEAFSNPKVEAARRFLARYQPFITTILAIFLIAVFLPGRANQTSAPEEASEFTGAAGGDLGEAGERAAGVTGAIRSGRTSRNLAVNPNVLSFEEAKKQGLALVDNCDLATGNVMIPSRFAPPCTQKFTPPNAGNTWQGVTDKDITVVWFFIEGNPAVDAFLAAAGANDSREQEEATVKEWGKLYEAHFNMWGRSVKWVFRDAQGDAEDDNAALADARAIANEDKAFAVINASNNTMVNELVARKVMCFCTTSLPIETYIKWSPYVWTSLMASTQGYIHRAEYVNRLKNKNAVWAQDDIDGPIGQNYREEKRRFGFIYYETENFDYRVGAEFFIKYLKETYGIVIPKDAISQYNGYPDISKTQEQSPGIVQRMRDAYGGRGATSIIFSGDPFGPAFFTKDAQSVRYGPEWVLTGSALTDTTFFARTYNQDQWAHAFGISYLAARLDEEKGGSARLYKWHYNKFPPPAEAGYGLMNAPISQMYNGFHMTGPSLTPENFKLGMYSLPIRGQGGITAIASSYGDKGLWPWKIDPVAADDATEIWWDRNARGPDEVGGVEADGMYRYVDGGKRYLTGEWPTSTPKAFDTKGTVLIYDNPPPQDQWPCYPSPATGKKDLC
jgi:hypothetical protein